MLTRPLDLSTRLRARPRSLDALFYVNAGLLVLFFMVFGSRYVMSPGLGVDFELPTVPGVNQQARMTTHTITVESAGQIFVADGVRTLDQLREWLNTEAKKEKHPVLLVEADARVENVLIMQIAAAAKQAGFDVVCAAKDTHGGNATSFRDKNP